MGVRRAREGLFMFSGRRSRAALADCSQQRSAIGHVVCAGLERLPAPVRI